MFSWKYSLISILLSAVLLVYLGRRLLRDEQGLLSYGEAVKYLFVAYLIAMGTGLVFNIVVHGKNEQMAQHFQEYSMVSQEAGIKLGVKVAGGSEARAQEEIELMREKYASGELEMPKYPFSFTQLPLMFFTSTIMSLFLSLFLALFVRKTG